MDSSISKQLVDKMYEKRKAAALELEKLIRECNQQGDHRRIAQIVDQLVDMFSNPSNPLQARNGGLIGLAGTAIALGIDISPYMEKFIQPLLICFADPENRVRYFSAECLYNIAKVSKGEILVYFNDIFDALSKLAADPEVSVKNGAELLDRLLKDIVAETASVYVPQYQETEKARRRADEKPFYTVDGVLIPHPDDVANGKDLTQARRAFSLAHFIPLLKDRMGVQSPFTRMYLVGWIQVLDSVPELELVSYLPEFLDSLLRYLSDPTDDVRTNTQKVLSEMLREIVDITVAQRAHELEVRAKREADSDQQSRRTTAEKDNLPDITLANSERVEFVPEYDEDSVDDDSRTPVDERDGDGDIDTRSVGIWERGLGVKIDYAAIVEILLWQLDGSPDHDEIQQSTALNWLSEFLRINMEVMVPFTPRLLRCVLPNMAHHVGDIQLAARKCNKQLVSVIQALPPPSESQTRQNTTDRSSTAGPSPLAPASPVPTTSALTSSRPSTATREPTLPPTKESSTESLPSSGTPTPVPTHRPRHSISQIETVRTASTATAPTTQVTAETASTQTQPSRPDSPLSTVSVPQVQQSPESSVVQEKEVFDYQGTVQALTIQFLSEHEETRVAALKWLIMLHQKAPKKILAMDDGTFPALLKTLSDTSEEVIKHDLQLLAQISSSSEESYFKLFMINLLELFSTDRKLLETRGSLIIRQLCLNLNTERIYRTFAEILEKEEDLEFASGMVVKLNMILITSPELSEFRRRLKSLEIRQDGQALFTTLYRSWCHNAVAVFSLCLLAQAYEHASNLLYIFADLDITVQMLVQIDKLVQLIESPVFTYLRLQLLEPEKHPHLFKCLYGLLMLLPQSSAFMSLRNRLNAVNSSGFLHIAPKSNVSNVSATRSKLGREEIKWAELLSHFRNVQSKHEKARRLATGSNEQEPSVFALPGSGPFMGGAADRENRDSIASSVSTINGNTSRPGMRRRVTGGAEPPALARPPSRTLSPLNPRRGSNSTMGFPSTLRDSVTTGPVVPSPASPTFANGQNGTQNQRQPKRTGSLSRKT
ncbi:ARM repeat-containing protein [Phanerochaete sordida]|uniref:ARM repeat-containing protein n=1 Tax=Phanerochaete sordida TaxID=48140 RepID=A0A9P3FWB7_9APHY|nr:ARM repeat-containing protein [Phanerochaete sordida]